MGGESRCPIDGEGETALDVQLRVQPEDELTEDNIAALQERVEGDDGLPERLGIAAMVKAVRATKWGSTRANVGGQWSREK